MGVVQTPAAIFKTGSRSNLVNDRHLVCVEELWERASLVAEMAAVKEGVRERYCC